MSASSGVSGSSVLNPFLLKDLVDRPFAIPRSQPMCEKVTVGNITHRVYDSSELSQYVRELRSKPTKNTGAYVLELLGEAFLANLLPERVTAAQLVRHSIKALHSFRSAQIESMPHLARAYSQVGGNEMEYILRTIVDDPIAQARTVRFWNTYIKIDRIRCEKLNSDNAVAFHILTNIPQLGALYLECPQKLIEMRDRVQKIIGGYYKLNKADKELELKSYSALHSEKTLLLYQYENDLKVQSQIVTELEPTLKDDKADFTVAEDKLVKDTPQYRLYQARTKGASHIEHILRLRNDLQGIENKISGIRTYLEGRDDTISHSIRKDVELLMIAAKERAAEMATSPHVIPAAARIPVPDPSPAPGPAPAAVPVPGPAPASPAPAPASAK